MAKRRKKAFVRVRCRDCGRLNYYMKKSKAMGSRQEKIETKKFCKWCQHHTVHAESKK